MPSSPQLSATPLGSERSAAPHPRHALGLLPLVALMYLVVSGGAYGLEDAVRLAGPRLVMLLCLVVPLTLSLPTALMAAELTALMPVEGGFYFWVKEGLGSFWGFAEAYLTLLYTAVDMAIYPVLFASYLEFFLPTGAGAQVAIAIAIVWAAGLLNLAGVRPVADSSMAFAAALIAPFVLLVLIGMPRIVHFSMPSAPLFGADPLGALGAGLTVVIWNFGGWENLSVVSAEIENPRRNYLRAIAIALPVIVAGYLLPLMVCLSGASNGAGWKPGAFAEHGQLIGGRWLGASLAIGGGVMSFAVFEAGMLWVSRMPYVLAHEGYLPAGLKRIWQASSTPARSIVMCSIVFTLLVPLGFVDLVVLDVFFYMAALVLEMAALISLRRRFKPRDGLFMVGGGAAGLWLVATLPIVTWVATFGLALSRSDGKSAFLVATLLALGVWPAYLLARRLYGGPVAANPVEGSPGNESTGQASDQRSFERQQ